MRKLFLLLFLVSISVFGQLNPTSIIGEVKVDELINLGEIPISSTKYSFSIPFTLEYGIYGSISEIQLSNNLSLVDPLTDFYQISYSNTVQLEVEADVSLQGNFYESCSVVTNRGKSLTVNVSYVVGDGRELIASVTNLDFGNVNSGSTKQVTLTANGGDIDILGYNDLASPFSIANPFYGTIVSGQSITLDIEFDPSGLSDGIYEDGFFVQNNGVSTVGITVTADYQTSIVASDWELRDPGSGGWNRAFVIDPTDKNVMYLASDRSGIYKSVDGGLTWNESMWGLYNIQVEDLDISPGGQWLLAGTSGGVYYSKDRGETWTHGGYGQIYYDVRTGTIPTDYYSHTDSWAVSSVHISKVDTTLWFAGKGSTHWHTPIDGSGAFYRSDDAGANWTEITIGASNAAVYHSYDGSYTYEDVTIRDYPGSVTTIMTDANGDRNIVYMGMRSYDKDDDAYSDPDHTERVPSFTNIWKSTDAGLTFVRPKGNTRICNPGDLLVRGDTVFYTRYLKLNQYGICRTFDGFNSYYPIGNGIVWRYKVDISSSTITSGDVGQTITAGSSSGTLYAVYSGYLLITPSSGDYGSQFAESNVTLSCNGHTALQTSGAEMIGNDEWIELEFDPIDRETMYASCNSDMNNPIWKSTNINASYSSVTWSGMGKPSTANWGGENAVGTTIDISGDASVIGVLSGGLNISYDYGGTWQERTSVDNGDGTFSDRGWSVLVPLSIGVSPYNNTLLYGVADEALLVSKDGGLSFSHNESVENISSSLYDRSRDMYALQGRGFAFDPNSSNNIYMVTSWYNLYRGKGLLLKSSDGGDTWTNTNSFMPNSETFVGYDTTGFTDIAMTADGNTMYISSYRGRIYKASSPFTSWSGFWSYSSGRIKDIEVDVDGNVYACKEQYGLHRTSNDGVSWTNLTDTELGYIYATSVEVHPLDKNIIFLTTSSSQGAEANAGVWRSTDFGATWTKVLSIDQRIHWKDVLFDPNDPNIVYACGGDGGDTYYGKWYGHHGGVHKSTDGGDTWEQLAGSSWSFNADLMGISGDGDLYVGLNSKGLWKWIEGTTEVTKPTILSQNHFYDASQSLVEITSQFSSNGTSNNSFVYLSRDKSEFSDSLFPATISGNAVSKTFTGIFENDKYYYAVIVSNEIGSDTTSIDSFLTTSIDTVTYYVSSGYDDGYQYYTNGSTGSRNRTNNTCVIGNITSGDSYSYNTFLRFPNINIPSTATILESKITVTASGSYSGTSVNLVATAEDVADPATIGDYTELVTKISNATTANNVITNYGAWTAEGKYDITVTASTQELFSSYTYNGTTAMLFMLLDNVGNYSDASAYRKFYSYENGSKFAKLTIIYSN